MKKKYQNGGPIKPNYQTLDNIKFDSNKARRGEYGQLIVKDENSGKDYGVIQNKDGSYQYWNPDKTTSFYESVNPKNWGISDHTQVPEFTSAFNLAKSRGEQEFMWKGNRYAVKDVPQSIKNAVEVARGQVIQDMENKRKSFSYEPTAVDTIDAILATKTYKQLGNKILDPNVANSLDSLVNTKYNEVFNRYQSKINKVKDSNPIVTNQKGNLQEDGYQQGKKLFVAASDSSSAVNIARHEFHHLTQDYYDTAFLGRDLDKINKAVNKSPHFGAYYGQDQYDYLSNPDEIGARLFNLQTLMQEKGLKTVQEARNWSLSNRKRRSGADPLQTIKDFDNSDPNYDVHQLLDMYGSDLNLLDTHMKEYQKPKTNFATGGYLQNNQMRKTKRKGYVSGGDITSIAPMLAELAGNYAGAAQYQFDPNGQAYKPDMQAGIQFGAAGVIPEIYKYLKDQKQRSSYVASATPGNYQQGGPIDRQRVKPRTININGMTRTDQMAASVPSAPVYANPLEQLSIFGLPPQPAPMNIVYPLPYPEMGGGSSKSKSRDRFREKATGGKINCADGGPIDPFYPFHAPIANDKITLGKAKSEEWKNKMTQADKKKAGWFNDDANITEDAKLISELKKQSLDSRNPEAGNFGTHNWSKEMGSGDTYGDMTLTMPWPASGVALKDRMDYYTAHFPSEMRRQARLYNATNTDKSWLGRNWSDKGWDGLNSFHDPAKGKAYGGRLDEDTNPNDKDDRQLSNSAFQVKGHPNVTDGNAYPELNANLDHNEVVKDNFVFSNKLKMPNGKSFADAARKLEISTGKSEKVLKSNPNDPFARATIAHNENRSNILAQEQETLATAKGLRPTNTNAASGGYLETPTGYHVDYRVSGAPPNVATPTYYDHYKGKDARNMATGGYTGGPDDPYTFPGERNTTAMNPFDATTGKRRYTYTADDFPGYLPAGNAGFIDLGRNGMFFDPYNKAFVVRNTKGLYVKVQPKEGTFDINGDTVKDIVTNKVFSINQHLDYAGGHPAASAAAQQLQLPTPIPSSASVSSGSNQSVASSDRPDIYGNSNYTSPTPGYGNPRPRSGAGNVASSRQGVPTTVDNSTPNQLPGQYDQDIYELMKQAANAGDLPLYRGSFDPGQADPNQILPPVTSQASPRATPNIASALNFGKSTTGTATGNQQGGIGQRFTIGDGLQALEVASKFGQLAGGADKERPYYDQTRITKENFDPSNALAQSQRNFQLSSNSLQNSSINQNRSFQNNLYAGKLNQDSDILAKYNQMNQGAVTQQEQRQADQRRYNIGQTTYTNDLNQRNRDQYRNALDTAFTSLGNLGQNLNQKRQGNDALNILRASYPEVYARIMKNLTNAG